MNEREAVLEETWLFFKKILGHWCKESLEVGLWSPIAFCDLPHTIGLFGAVLACWFLLIWVTLLGQFTQAGHFKQSGYLCLNLPRKKSCLCWGSGCTTQNLTLRFHENCRGKEHLWPSSGGRSNEDTAGPQESAAVALAMLRKFLTMSLWPLYPVVHGHTVPIPHHGIAHCVFIYEGSLLIYTWLNNFVMLHSCFPVFCHRDVTTYILTAGIPFLSYSSSQQNVGPPHLHSFTKDMSETSPNFRGSHFCFRIKIVFILKTLELLNLQ